MWILKTPDIAKCTRVQKEFELHMLSLQIFGLKQQHPHMEHLNVSVSFSEPNALSCFFCTGAGKWICQVSQLKALTVCNCCVGACTCGSYFLSFTQQHGSTVNVRQIKQTLFLGRLTRRACYTCSKSKMTVSCCNLDQGCPICRSRPTSRSQRECW